MKDDYRYTGAIARRSPFQGIAAKVRKIIAEHQRQARGPHGQLAGRKYTRLPGGVVVETWVNPYGLHPIVMARVYFPSGELLVPEITIPKGFCYVPTALSFARYGWGIPYEEQNLPLGTPLTSHFNFPDYWKQWRRLEGIGFVSGIKAPTVVHNQAAIGGKRYKKKIIDDKIEVFSWMDPWYTFDVGAKGIPTITGYHVYYNGKAIIDIEFPYFAIAVSFTPTYVYVILGGSGKIKVGRWAISKDEESGIFKITGEAAYSSDVVVTGLSTIPIYAAMNNACTEATILFHHDGMKQVTISISWPEPTLEEPEPVAVVEAATTYHFVKDEGGPMEWTRDEQNSHVIGPVYISCQGYATSSSLVCHVSEVPDDAVHGASESSTEIEERASSGRVPISCDYNEFDELVLDEVEVEMHRRYVSDSTTLNSLSFEEYKPWDPEECEGNCCINTLVTIVGKSYNMTQNTEIHCDVMLYRDGEQIFEYRVFEQKIDWEDGGSQSPVTRTGPDCYKNISNAGTVTVDSKSKYMAWPLISRNPLSPYWLVQTGIAESKDGSASYTYTESSSGYGYNPPDWIIPYPEKNVDPTLDQTVHTYTSGNIGYDHEVTLLGREARNGVGPVPIIPDNTITKEQQYVELWDRTYAFNSLNRIIKMLSSNQGVGNNGWHTMAYLDELASTVNDEQFDAIITNEDYIISLFHPKVDGTGRDPVVLCSVGDLMELTEVSAIDGAIRANSCGIIK